MEWKAAKHTRDNASVVSKVNGSLNYGGTPSDQSILEACKLLKASGYKVTLHPMLYVDLPGKPWRGLINANSDKDVKRFFKQYNSFITHYATLEHEGKKLKDYLHSFIIGSELRDLLKYQNKVGKFIAVEEMTKLAKTVHTNLGKKVQLTYAANWDEYHHTDNGWYHLDQLWSSPYISFVGINAYFPLTDNLPQKAITYEKIKQGWESGEYYEYVKDTTGKHQTIEPKWAVKNIEHWWKSYHYNPNKKVTNWKPKMKKIIFTEFGFASIDGTTNQPNAFIDLTQQDYTLPIGSKGRVDYKAQRTAIEATLDYWRDKSSLKENKGLVSDAFLYAVDARHNFYNYPNLYSDAVNYDYGHWVKPEETAVTDGYSDIVVLGTLMMFMLSFVIIMGLYKITMNRSLLRQDTNDLEEDMD
jgi:hypothetical protein